MKKYAVLLAICGSLITGISSLTYWRFYPPTDLFDTEPSLGVYDKAGYTFATTEPLTGWGDPRLLRQSSETDLQFASRISMEIHLATYHCYLDKYYQNPLAYIAAALKLLPTDYGLLTPSEMRCGLCLQRSWLVAEALRRGGMPSGRILGLNGHVVTAFNSDGATYAIDADFGVGPFRYDGKHDNEIVGAYTAALPKYPLTRDLIVKAYASRDDNLDIPVKMLEDAEKLQSNVLQSARVVRSILMAIGLACLGLGIALLVLAPRAKKPSPVLNEVGEAR